MRPSIPTSRWGKLLENARTSPFLRIAKNSVIILYFPDGLFDEWINEQEPSPRWTPLILPDETLADDLFSGNASPATQTPLANSGNITPDDENQAGDGYNVAVGQPAVGEDNSNDASAAVDRGGTSNEGDSGGAQSISHSSAVPSLPTQPGSRGGHQMVIDSSSQVSLDLLTVTQFYCTSLI